MSDSKDIKEDSHHGEAGTQLDSDYDSKGGSGSGEEGVGFGVREGMDVELSGERQFSVDTQVSDLKSEDGSFYVTTNDGSGSKPPLADGALGAPYSSSRLADNDEDSLSRMNSMKMNPTLGQMAEQMQIKARADALNAGVKDVTEFDDEDGYEIDSNVCPLGTEHTGRWTKKEHELFLDALKKYGKEWKKVAAMVKTRSVVQTRTHAQKYFQKVHKLGSPAHSVQMGIEGPANLSGYTKTGRVRKKKRLGSGSSGGGSQKSGGYYDEEDDYDEEDYYEGVDSGLTAMAGMPYQHGVLKTPMQSISRSGKISMSTLSSLNGGSSTHGPITTLNSPSNTYGSSVLLNLSIPTPIARSAGPPGVSLPNDFPQPSPAACGKRKQAELAVAKQLVSSSSKHYEGADVLSKLKDVRNKPGEVIRRRNAALSIINPSSIMDAAPNSGLEQPETPWETEVKDLMGGGKGSFVMPATPAGQRDIYSQLMYCVQNGLIAELRNTLKQAEALPSPVAKLSRADIEDSHELADSSASAAADITAEGEAEDGQSSTGTAPRGTATAEANDSDAERNGGNSKLPHRSPVPSSSSPLGRMLNKRGKKGETLILMACELDPEQYSQKAVHSIVVALIDYGAVTTCVLDNGNTPLHLAAKVGYEKVGRLLLTRGCSVNAVNDSMESAMHVAAEHGQTLFLELLVDFGANCHLRNGNCKSALDCLGESDTEFSDRSELRRVLLSLEPRLRTLILFHDDCLAHTARTSTDWEGPDRLSAIMGRLQDPKEFPEYELEVSSQFEKAAVDLLGRVHSAEYITFVDNLSKSMVKPEAPVGGKFAAGSDRDHVFFADEGGGESLSSGGAAGNFVVPFTPHVQKAMLRQNSDEVKAPEYCDTAFSAGTLRAARRAAGAVAHAVDRILLGRNRNAFCVVRPPGHHAGYRGLLDGGRSCGFCIFNSVAAGALHALEHHQQERVAIIDLDVHHGNGTEDIVRRYKSPSKLFFFSLHLYDKDDKANYEFFPGSGEKDDTAHNIINVPLNPMWVGAPKGPNPTTRGKSAAIAGNHKGSQSDSREAGSSSGVTAPSDAPGRAAYRAAVLQRLIPSLRAFSPSLILLSTGFDAAMGDLGNSRAMGPGLYERGMDLMDEDFEWVTTEILKVADICCNGRVVSVLEGGYGCCKPANKNQLDRSLLARSAVAHVHKLVDPFG